MSGVEGECSELYIEFDNLDIPDNAQNGEYSYAVIFNGRDDVEYEFKNVLLDSVVKTDDGNVLLRDLKPIVGLLRIGKVKELNEYKGNTTNNYYYKG